MAYHNFAHFEAETVPDVFVDIEARVITNVCVIIRQVDNHLGLNSGNYSAH